MTGSRLLLAADPGAGYRALKPEIDEAVARVLGSGWYVLGAEGAAFEREFASWQGVPHAIGCGNGTDALSLALRALQIGPGCAVATVSHTAVATVAAIEMAGAVPVLLDIDPDHYTMDVAELAAVLADPPPGLPPIRAVIAVHLYGQAAEIETISELCARYGAVLIEDCSQAHGASAGEKMVGRFGSVGTFSFYPTKNLGALGDGGMVTTADEAVAERIGALRQYGWRQHYVSDLVGVNSRLDEMQAAILRVKLTYLDAANDRRRAIADRYDDAALTYGLRPPARRLGCHHVFHQYVLRVPERDRVQAILRGRGIGTGVHYPVPVHRQPAYLGRVALGPAQCIETERAAREVMSLPMYPELADGDVGRVCDALGEILPVEA